MNKINKPITVIREETIEKLAATINESGLPAFIVEPILQNFLNDTRTAMKRQYEIEKAQYEDAVAAEEKK